MTMTTLGEKILIPLRAKISVVDNELLLLIKKRCDIIDTIGKEKKKGSIPIVQDDRWQQILHDRITQGKLLGISQELIEEIWEVLHKHSILLQQQK